MDGPLCRLDRVSQHCRLDHFAPRHQEVVTTEVEDAFRGFPWLRAVAVKGKLSHQGQYNSTVAMAAYVLDLSGRSSRIGTVHMHHTSLGGARCFQPLEGHGGCVARNDPRTSQTPESSGTLPQAECRQSNCCTPSRYFSLKQVTSASSTSASATSGFSVTKVCQRNSCKAWWYRTA